MNMGQDKSTILFVNDCWTSKDSFLKTSFSSEGSAVLRGYLKKIGITPVRYDLHYTSVMQEWPKREGMSKWFVKTTEAKTLTPMKGLYPKPEMLDALQELDALIEEIAPDLIITLGDYPLWALTDDEYRISNSKGFKVPTGSGSYHGSQLYSKTGIPLLPLRSLSSSMAKPYWWYQTQYDLFARIGNWKEGAWEEPKYKFLIRPSFKEALSRLVVLSVLAEEGPLKLAVDIETRYGHIACIGLAWTDRTAMCIPLMCAEREEGYWTQEEEEEIIYGLSQLLTHPNCQLRGQNFSYDNQHIWKHWMFLPKIHQDTMLMQHLLLPGTELNLGYLSSRYCRYHRYWKDDGKTWTQSMDEEQLWVYNCRDCVTTYEVADQLEAQIEKDEVLSELWPLQREQQEYIIDMMVDGVLIDLEEKHKASFELEAAYNSYAERLEELLPEDVYPRKPKASPWYTSPTQQSEIFTGTFGMKPYWSKKLRRYTLDDSALKHFEKSEPLLAPLCETLRRFRSLKTYRTFTEMRLDGDNRMRSSFTPTASTFRWKSSENAFGNGGNLQNLPKGEKE